MGQGIDHMAQPTMALCCDCWVDADFAGNWHQADTHIGPMTSKSRSG